MTTSPAFWNRIAEKYAAKPIADMDAYNEKLRRIGNYLGPQMHMLEVGCGTGGTAMALAPQVQHIHAIDYSRKMIDIANQTLKSNAITNLVFEQADIEKLTLEAMQFDAVLLMSLLHLLPRPDDTLNKVFASLKPGGVLVTSTPCLKDTHAWLGWVAPVASLLRLMPYLKCVSRKDHIASLREAGFEIEEVWQPQPQSAVFAIARKPVL